MLDMPALKFDKSIKYLKSQINIQKNNKNLILDIISNIGLILNTSEGNNEKLQIVLDTANDFLQNISNNITSLEQLDLEISNITADLNDIISSQSKGNKTKEYYIAAFSNVKNNIIQYKQNFQNIENKLDIDNNNFNDFIKDNEFKYTLHAVNDNSENTYELTSFSINNDSTSISTDLPTTVTNDEDIIDNGIEEAMFETVTEEPVFQETSNVEENTSIEESVSEEILEEPVLEEINDEVVEEPVLQETPNIEESISEGVLEEPIIEEINNEAVDVPVIENDNIESPTQNINEITNNFKSILIDLYDNKISEDEFNNYITELKSQITGINNKDSVNSVEPVNEELSVEELFSETEPAEIAINEEIVQNNENTTIENEPEASIIETSIDHSITSNENQTQYAQDRHHSIEELIKKIKSADDKNKTLLISEKTNKVYLPYRITELQNYMEYYPKAYKSLSDVVEQEFIINLDTFARHPSKARFSETYNLVRNRSGKSVLKALSYAIKLKNKRTVDPAVIAACKNEYELHCYLYCLEQNKLDSFKFFNIVYDVCLF